MHFAVMQFGGDYCLLTSLLSKGTKRAQAAEFEVTSVKQAAMVEQRRQMTQASHPSTSSARLFATQSEKPDSSDATAIA